MSDTNPLGRYSLVQWLIFIVVIGGIVAIVHAASRFFGIPIPPFVIYVLWIVVAVLFIVAAIKFLASLLQ